MGDGGDEAPWRNWGSAPSGNRHPAARGRSGAAYIEDSRVRNGGYSVITGWDGYMDHKASDLSLGNAGGTAHPAMIVSSPGPPCQRSVQEPLPEFQSMDGLSTCNEPEGACRRRGTGGAEAAGVQQPTQH